MEFLIDTDEKEVGFLELLEASHPELKKDIRNGKINLKGQTIEIYGP